MMSASLQWRQAISSMPVLDLGWGNDTFTIFSHLVNAKVIQKLQYIEAEETSTDIDKERLFIAEI